jgi:hypothetical protein
VAGFAVPSAVLTVKLTPPARAGAERVTVKVNVVVPAFVSAWVTLPIESVGGASSF